MFKDTEKGRKFKKEMDQKYPRKKVSKEKLRDLLTSLRFSELIELCIGSNIDIIDYFLSKSNKDIDDSLFQFFHGNRKFAFKLEEM